MTEPEAPVRAADLEVTRVGQGPPVVFVHGSIVGAGLTWRRQHPLAEDWELILVNRPGFGRSPAPARSDFEVEAPLFAEFLGEGAHLVGHSYGAVIALLAAAERPGAVLSLTVSEPGALRFAGTAEAERMMADGERLYAAHDSISPDAFLRMFRWGAGSSRPTPPHLSEELRRGARMAMRERPAWEAEIPLEGLADRFPVLAISGGHSPVFEAVCDRLSERLGAERAVIEGKGHNVPETGAPYNERLQRFLAAAS